MMKYWLVGIAAIAIASCSQAKPMDFTICERAIIATATPRGSDPDAKDTASSTERIARIYEQVASRFASMDVRNCTDQQKISVRLWREAALRVAASARDIPDESVQQTNTPSFGAGTAKMMQFVREVKSYENRVCVARHDLKAQLEKLGKPSNDSELNCSRPRTASPAQ